MATCLQIILYKRNIPLISQEEISYELGLIVPEKDRCLFTKAYTDQSMPPAGWGTRLFLPQFSLSKMLTKFDIPLRVRFEAVEDAATLPVIIESLRHNLQQVEKNNKDALICFNYGALYGTADAGHFCVFDRIKGDTVQLIDPALDAPKIRQVSLGKLADAIRVHTSKSSGGLWFFEDRG